MNAFKLLLALAVAGVAYQSWTHRQRGAEPASAAAPSDSRNGFVALPPVTGPGRADVLVVAAENCPEEAAQRADRLAEQLARNGVAVSRVHTVSFEIPNADQAVADRVMAVMNGELPIVVVRGKARANPTLDDVTAELRSASP